MAGQLSDEDKVLIATLRKEGVLQHVKDHLLDQRAGVILVTCADGDRFFDVYRHLCGMQKKHRPPDLEPRTHILGWHGGAIACVPNSPINTHPAADTVFLDQIRNAPDFKNIPTVALYAHGPCGAAAHAGVSLREVICLQFRAKLRIKSLREGLVVASFFHVDYGGGVKRTYFLSRPEWEAWSAKNCHCSRAVSG